MLSSSSFTDLAERIEEARLLNQLTPLGLARLTLAPRVNYVIQRAGDPDIGRIRRDRLVGAE